MQYLIERYDSEYKISFPKGTREWYEMNNWLFFMNAGVGPMQGQASRSLSHLSIPLYDGRTKGQPSGDYSDTNTIQIKLRELITRPRAVLELLLHHAAACIPSGEGRMATPEFPSDFAPP